VRLPQKNDGPAEKERGGLAAAPWYPDFEELSEVHPAT